VARRILVVVRLDLYDPAADAVEVELGADEPARDLQHRAAQVHASSGV
jgi:hypothetical protein